MNFIGDNFFCCFNYFSKLKKNKLDELIINKQRLDFDKYCDIIVIQYIEIKQKLN